MSESLIMDAGTLERCLLRMACEIGEDHPQLLRVKIIGIHTRGVPLARRLAALLSKQFPGQAAPLVGQLDIAFHRDDQNQSSRPPKLTDISFDITDAEVILVDDVIFSGRTIRAALNALSDIGRPDTIRSAVLIDRGFRKLPIHADYVGKLHEVADPGRIVVKLAEMDGVDEVRVRT